MLLPSRRTYSRLAFVRGLVEGTAGHAAAPDGQAVSLRRFAATDGILDVLKKVHAVSSVKQIQEAVFLPLCLFYVRIRKKQANGMTGSFQKT